MKKYNLKGCFRELNTEPRNLRWSWSGRSADGSKVSVTQDQFSDGGKLYLETGFSQSESWVGSNGHRELIENLAWAQDELGGIVSVIVAIAKDLKSSPRSIKECFPVINWRMKIISLDRSSGEFVLEKIAAEGGVR